MRVGDRISARFLHDLLDPPRTGSWGVRGQAGQGPAPLWRGRAARPVADSSGPRRGHWRGWSLLGPLAGWALVGFGRVGFGRQQALQGTQMSKASADGQGGP